MDIDLCTGSLSDLLNAEHMVEVTVGEEYLAEGKSLSGNKIEETSAVAADVDSDAAVGSGLDDITVGLDRTKLESIDFHIDLTSYSGSVDGNNAFDLSDFFKQVFELFGIRYDYRAFKESVAVFENSR